MSTLIIGAGPAGIATAGALDERRLPYVWVDRAGTVGGAYAHIYPKLPLASPRRYTWIFSGRSKEGPEYIRAGEYADYLRTVAAEKKLQPQKGEVRTVRQSGDVYEVSLDDGTTKRFAAVVVASGMYDFPVKPAIAGLTDAATAKAEERPTVIHSGAWQGPQAYDGKRVLVLGGATSAIEIAEACAGMGIETIVSARQVRIMRQRFLGRDVHDYLFLSEALPRWALGSFCDRLPTLPGADLGFAKYCEEGAITVRPWVVRFEGRCAQFSDGTSSRPIDVVVLATGYRWRAPFLPEDIARTTAGHPRGNKGESINYPGLFFVGAPCGRRLNSEFLRGIRVDAQYVARRVERRLHRLGRFGALGTQTQQNSHGPSQAATKGP